MASREKQRTRNEGKKTVKRKRESKHEYAAIIRAGCSDNVMERLPRLSILQ